MRGACQDEWRTGASRLGGRSAIDADRISPFPAAPTAFCTANVAGLCMCGPSQTLCVAPYPTAESASLQGLWVYPLGCCTPRSRKS